MAKSLSLAHLENGYTLTQCGWDLFFGYLVALLSPGGFAALRSITRQVADGLVKSLTVLFWFHGPVTIGGSIFQPPFTKRNNHLYVWVHVEFKYGILLVAHICWSLWSYRDESFIHLDQNSGVLWVQPHLLLTFLLSIYPFWRTYTLSIEKVSKYITNQQKYCKNVLFTFALQTALFLK